jgi:hypothetical protein
MGGGGPGGEFAVAAGINNCDLRLENHEFLPVNKSQIYCLPAIIHDFCGFANSAWVLGFWSLVFVFGLPNVVQWRLQTAQSCAGRGLFVTKEPSVVSRGMDDKKNYNFVGVFGVKDQALFKTTNKPHPNIDLPSEFSDAAYFWRVANVFEG